MIRAVIHGLSGRGEGKVMALSPEPPATHTHTSESAERPGTPNRTAKGEHEEETMTEQRTLLSSC